MEQHSKFQALFSTWQRSGQQCNQRWSNVTAAGIGCIQKRKYAGLRAVECEFPGHRKRQRDTSLEYDTADSPAARVCHCQTNRPGVKLCKGEGYRDAQSSSFSRCCEVCAESTAVVLCIGPPNNIWIWKPVYSFSASSGLKVRMVVHKNFSIQSQEKRNYPLFR